MHWLATSVHAVRLTVLLRLLKVSDRKDLVRGKFKFPHAHDRNHPIHQHLLSNRGDRLNFVENPSLSASHPCLYAAIANEKCQSLRIGFLQSRGDRIPVELFTIEIRLWSSDTLSLLIHSHVNPQGTFELDTKKRLPIDTPVELLVQ